MSKLISAYAQLSDLIITQASGANGTSRIVSAPSEYSDAIALMLYSPSVMPETVIIEVNRDPAALAGDANWVTLQNGPQGSTLDMTVPGASKARLYSDVIFSGAFRLKCVAGVAADRTFRINKLFTI